MTPFGLGEALSDCEKELADAKATIEMMSGDAADLINLMDEAAALRTALGHTLIRVHDSGCGTCDAARALLPEPLGRRLHRRLLSDEEHVTGEAFAQRERDRADEARYEGEP